MRDSIIWAAMQYEVCARSSDTSSCSLRFFFLLFIYPREDFSRYKKPHEPWRWEYTHHGATCVADILSQYFVVLRGGRSFSIASVFQPSFEDDGGVGCTRLYIGIDQRWVIFLALSFPLRPRFRCFYIDLNSEEIPPCILFFLLHRKLAQILTILHTHQANKFRNVHAYMKGAPNLELCQFYFALAISRLKWNYFSASHFIQHIWCVVFS